jgi:hypothetical protein
MGNSFLRFWRFSAIILYLFCLQLFFFDAHDLQVWSFDGVAEFLCILFAAFDSSQSSSVYSLISISSSSPEIISSACSSLLAWLSPIFFV